MIKFKRINWDFVKKNYPVLYESIQGWEEFHTFTERQKEYVAGLCIEIALQADGTVNIFLDEEPEEDWDEID